MNRRSSIGLTTFVAAFLFVIYLPNILIAIFAFNDGIYVAFPLKGMTTRWFGQLVGARGLIDALANSLMVGLIVSATSTVMGAGAAYALAYKNFPMRRTALAGIAIALVAPVMILALALSLFLQMIGFGLSLWTALIGHLVLCMPFAAYVIMSRMSGFDMNLEEAARDLGLGPVEAFLRVWLPLAGPAIVSAFLLSFTISFDDFMMSFFLIGSDTTLPIYIWGQLRYPQKLPEVLALATVMFAVSIVLVASAEWLARRGPTSH